MNTLKRIALTFAFIAFSFVGFTTNYDASSRTMVHNYRASDKDVLLDIGCDVIIRQWKGDDIRVMVEVKYDSHRAQLIKELAKMHRYDMKVKKMETVDIITMPELKKIVRINGSVLQEQVAFKVLIPQEMGTYIHPNGSIALSKTIKSPTL